jgi:hypothetical protein
MMLKIIALIFTNFALMTLSTYAANFSSKETKVESLSYSKNNGSIYGPALPGTHGIEVKKNLPLSKVSDSAFLIAAKGTYCQLGLVSLDDKKMNNYQKKHHYGVSDLMNYGNNIVIRSRNMYHDPDTLLIQCFGSQNALMNLTLGQIENDLGNAIEFYKN